MKSQNKKSKSIDKKSKKIKEKLNPDEININILKKYLTNIIPRFVSTDYDLIYTIFGKREQEYLSLIDNVRKEHRSDSIICYGNNNQILKVFIDNAIKNYSEQISISTIVINGYFDSNEESLLKEICNNLNIKSKAGYDNYKKALDNFFLKKTQDEDETMIIIYCDYIDHLVHKKKQRLLYTLFELINKSRNILLIGFTYNYNLMDQMEKRIRSRSTQKTMYINIEDYEKVLNALEKAFHKNIFNNEENDNNKDRYNEEEIQELKVIGQKFYDCLINEESDDYVFYLEKLVKLGTSIDGILTKIQNHLLMIKIEVDNYQKEKNTDVISKKDLSQIIIKLTKKIVENEKRGYTLNMLLKCSKFQLTLFICLTACVSQFRDKIVLSTFYNRYKTIVSDYLSKRSNYDLILIQKYLEDLNNCNLISIKNDEKYGKLYQLKLPLCEIRKILQSLKRFNKLDSEMIKLCDNIKW
jgi:hypothetical protein